MSRRPIGSNAILALMGQWSRLVVQIAGIALFSRLLAPSELGLVAMVTAIIGIAGIVGDLGLSLAAIQARHLSHQQSSNLFWLNCALGSAMSIAVAASAPLIALFYDDNAVAPIALWLAIGFVMNGAAVQFRVMLNRAERFGSLAIIDSSSQLVGFLCGLVVALWGGSYWAIVVQQLTTAAIALISSIFASKWSPARPRRGHGMLQLVRYGWHTFLTQIANYLSSNVATIAIGQVWGQASVGYYSRAYQLAFTPGQQIASPLTRVMLPRLSAQATNASAFISSAKRLQLMLIYTIGSVLSFVAASATALVPVALGPNWQPAIVLVQILAVNATITLISYNLYWLLLAKSETKLLFVTEVAARTLMVVFILAAVAMGEIWVAWGSVGGAMLLVLGYMLIGLPRIGINPKVMLPETLRPLIALVFPGVSAWAATVPTSEMGLPPLLILLYSLGAWMAGAALVAASSAPVRRDVKQIVNELRTMLKR